MNGGKLGSQIALVWFLHFGLIPAFWYFWRLHQFKHSHQTYNLFLISIPLACKKTKTLKVVGSRSTSVEGMCRAVSSRWKGQRIHCISGLQVWQYCSCIHKLLFHPGDSIVWPVAWADLFLLFLNLQLYSMMLCSAAASKHSSLLRLALIISFIY